MSCVCFIVLGHGTFLLLFACNACMHLQDVTRPVQLQSLMILANDIPCPRRVNIHQYPSAAAQNKHMQNVIRTLVVIGVGMIMGDGVLTPSVSVLSAMEGLAVAVPSIQKGSRAPTVLSDPSYDLSALFFLNCRMLNLPNVDARVGALERETYPSWCQMSCEVNRSLYLPGLSHGCWSWGNGVLCCLPGPPQNFILKQ